MIKLNPYLCFAGNATEAIDFYKQVFQTEPASVSLYKDTPADAGVPVSEAEKDRVMHAAFNIGNDMLMISDGPVSLDNTLVMGNSTQISVHPDSREEADRIFAALIEGGESVMPMSDAFWGDYFGMAKDKFGIRWMVNYHKDN